MRYNEEVAISSIAADGDGHSHLLASTASAGNINVYLAG
jgi:hypothetical protein